MKRTSLAICMVLLAILGYGSVHAYGAPPPLPAPAGPSGQTTTLGTYTVIGWNDLGMHCLSPRFAEITILPPYNDLMTVAIRRGEEPSLVTTNVSLSYSLNNNTTVVGKTDFWTYASQIFGKTVPFGIGLTGHGLSGNLAAVGGDHFEATGIPVLPYDDAKVWNPYQRGTVRMTATRTPGSFTASVVIPTSDEMNCAKCHSNGGVAAPGITSTTLEQNILKLHDLRHKTNMMGSRPVMCSSCHSDNALGTAGIAGVESLSGAMHAKHASIANAPACQDCHPGAVTKCNRSAITAMGPSGTDPGCTKCHGSLQNVSDTIKAGRVPWLQEPTCSQCHGAAYATKALYRKSTGHGGVPCAACHNSPHAWYPSMRSDDNVQPVALQGSSKAMGAKCSVCHNDGRTGTMPPHDRTGIIGGYTPPVPPGDGMGGTGGGTTGGGTVTGPPWPASVCANCHSDGRSGTPPPGHRDISAYTGGTTGGTTGGGTTGGGTVTGPPWPASVCANCHSDGRSGTPPPGHRDISAYTGGTTGGTTGGGTTGGGTAGGGTTGGGTTGGGTVTGPPWPASVCANCHSDGRSGTPPAGHRDISAYTGGTTGGTTGGGTTGGGTVTGPPWPASVCANCHNDGRSGTPPPGHRDISAYTGVVTGTTGGTTGGTRTVDD